MAKVGAAKPKARKGQSTAPSSSRSKTRRTATTSAKKESRRAAAPAAKVATLQPRKVTGRRNVPAKTTAAKSSAQSAAKGRKAAPGAPHRQTGTKQRKGQRRRTRRDDAEAASDAVSESTESESAEGDDRPSQADDAGGGKGDVEQTQRYRQWFPFAEMAAFLAEAEHALVRTCCRVLPQLTVCPGSSPALFAVATHGVTPPGSPTTTGEAPHPGTSGEAHEDSQGPLPSQLPAAAARARPGDQETVAFGGAKLPLPLLGGDHEEVYRTIRNTIAASCALGHRSCQAVWGPRGSGKHRLVRRLAQECALQPSTLVLQLDGGLLNSDEDAIRSIAQQMLDFLLSPQSAAVRAADWSVRTGTFDFGRLFRYDRAMQAAGLTGEDAVADGGGGAGGVRPVGGTLAARRHHPNADEQRPSDDYDDDDAEEALDGPFITTTTAHLVGGAASALPPLQRALLLLKHNHVNLVVCIRQADRFGIWCDQLLYVLAGLMHEGDGQGGGMSLLLTSAAPDLRQMEKRLSSRLTGETRFVPLLPWTPRRMLRALLSLVKELCECQIAAKAVATEAAAATPQRKKGRQRGGTGSAPAADEQRQQQLLERQRRQVLLALSQEWQERVAALEQVLPADVADLLLLPARGSEDGASCGASAGGVSEAQSKTTAVPVPGGMPSLKAHPTLLLETVAILSHDLLQQLDASTHKLKRRPVGHAAATTAAPAHSLIKRIQELNEDLRNTGATADVVMTAVVNCLCKTATGALDALGGRGRQRAMEWLDSRQGGEPEWPWLSNPLGACNEEDREVDAPGAAFPAADAPRVVRQRWAAVAAAAGAPMEAAPTSPEATRAPVLAPLPPDLFTLLDGGELVRLGYASRETVHLLLHILVQAEAGVRSRSVADLLEDVTSAMGTRAAAAVDTEAYRAAVRQLCRWKLLRVIDEDSEVVTLCGSVSRLREFLRTVLEHRTDWCEGGILGLDAKDYMRMRSLV